MGWITGRTIAEQINPLMLLLRTKLTRMIVCMSYTGILHAGGIGNAVVVTPSIAQRTLSI